MRPSCSCPPSYLAKDRNTIGETGHLERPRALAGSKNFPVKYINFRVDSLFWLVEYHLRASCRDPSRRLQTRDARHCSRSRSTGPGSRSRAPHSPPSRTYSSDLEGAFSVSQNGRAPGAHFSMSVGEQSLHFHADLTSLRFKPIHIPLPPKKPGVTPAPFPRS